MSKSINSTFMNIEPIILLELSLGSSIGQLRAIPVKIKTENNILVVYSSNFEIDPFIDMFYFPDDTLKMALFDMKGEMIWKKDLGKGVVPGIWFCPVFAFDLDRDGVEEIWYINNVNKEHPLSLRGYRLEKLDAEKGMQMGQYQWPYNGFYNQSMSHAFRNFIMGGYVKDEPVLVTAQGTYDNMSLQGWNSDMSIRWEHNISENEPGGRGSHVSPLVDINNDGIDELMWGERCIELDTGKELFCCDRNSYGGHSDLVQPVYNYQDSKWYIYTAREQDSEVSPRVALFNDKGEMIWGAIDRGHMDINWVATMGKEENPIAMSIKIGKKICGPDGRFRQDCEQFAFDVFTGDKKELPFNAYAGIYGRLPVDINGDGVHEFFGDGELITARGEVVGVLGGDYAMLSKFYDHPGEQILCYYNDGTIRIWGDKNAIDNEVAKRRYNHPFYQLNQKLTGVGYNLMLLGGI